MWPTDAQFEDAALRAVLFLEERTRPASQPESDQDDWEWDWPDLVTDVW